MKDGRFRTFTTADGLPDDVVMEIEEDPAGDLWLVTPQGLARCSNGSLHRVTPDEGLPDMHATAVAAERSGRAADRNPDRNLSLTEWPLRSGVRR